MSQKTKADPCKTQTHTDTHRHTHTDTYTYTFSSAIIKNPEGRCFQESEKVKETPEECRPATGLAIT